MATPAAGPSVDVGVQAALAAPSTIQAVHLDVVKAITATLSKRLPRGRELAGPGSSLRHVLTEHEDDVWLSQKGRARAIAYTPHTALFRSIVDGQGRLPLWCTSWEVARRVESMRVLALSLCMPPMLPPFMAMWLPSACTRPS